MVLEDTEDQETLEALTPVLYSGSSENKENDRVNNLNVLEPEEEPAPPSSNVDTPARNYNVEGRSWKSAPATSSVFLSISPPYFLKPPPLPSPPQPPIWPTTVFIPMSKARCGPMMTRQMTSGMKPTPRSRSANSWRRGISTGPPITSTRLRCEGDKPRARPPPFPKCSVRHAAGAERVFTEARIKGDENVENAVVRWW